MKYETNDKLNYIYENIESSYKWVISLGYYHVR